MILDPPTGKAQLVRQFFRHHLYLVRTRLWLVMLITLIGISIGAAIVSHIRPLYRASALVLVEPSSLPKVTSLHMSSVTPSLQDGFRRTQLKFLKSKSVAQKVIATLQLDQHPEFIRVYSPFHMLLRRLHIQPDPTSHLISISFIAHDPKLAASVPNQWAQGYMHQVKHQRFEKVREGLDWLKARVEDIEQQVVQWETELRRYQREHPTYALDSELPSVMQQLLATHSALTAAQTERLQHQALYQKLQRVIPSLRHAWPIDHEPQPTISTAQARYEEVKAYEAALLSRYHQLKHDVQALHAKALHYHRLKRDVESHQQLAQESVGRLGATQLNMHVSGGPRIELVDAAEIPTAPINYRPVYTISVSGFLALGIALGIAAALPSSRPRSPRSFRQLGPCQDRNPARGERLLQPSLPPQHDDLIIEITPHLTSFDAQANGFEANRHRPEIRQ